MPPLGLTTHGLWNPRNDEWDRYLTDEKKHETRNEYRHMLSVLYMCSDRMHSDALGCDGGFTASAHAALTDVVATLRAENATARDTDRGRQRPTRLRDSHDRDMHAGMLLKTGSPTSGDSKQWLLRQFDSDNETGVLYRALIDSLTPIDREVTTGITLATYFADFSDFISKLIKKLHGCATFHSLVHKHVNNLKIAPSNPSMARNSVDLASKIVRAFQLLPEADRPNEYAMVGLILSQLRSRPTPAWKQQRWSPARS
eukprot:jgi/Tetstr1/432134/TSEL_021591.t1